MRWLLRHRIGGWEHFNMQLNLLMASLYNVVVVTISVYTDISPLNVYHNPVFNNQCLYLCFPSEHMPSFLASYDLRVNRVHCYCSVITQSFFLSFKSSLCLSPWDISLAHWYSPSQFSPCTFSTQYLHLSKEESLPSVDWSCLTVLLQVIQQSISSGKSVLVSEQD